MKPQIASLIACVNIGLFLPAVYANGVAYHPKWVVLAVVIGLSCHFLISFLMSKLSVTLEPPNGRH